MLSLVVRVLFGLALVTPLYPRLAEAHEIRPAYLQIDEVSPNRYAVLWRTPILSGMRLPVGLRFPSEVRDVIEPSTRELPNSSSNDKSSMHPAASRESASSSLPWKRRSPTSLSIPRGSTADA